MSLLETISSPADLKELDKAQLVQLASEIREHLLAVTARNGGHIGPNLGVVELTLGLHRIFQCPQDRFVFDVSHQGYVHKLLTGRKGAAFERIRKTDGLSGFLSREESPYDVYGAGHAGTALSAALGMAVARDRKGEGHHVVAIIGDASLTCGITMEALNNIDAATRRLIVVLNDNQWSISKNVGAIARYLNQLITAPVYNKTHKKLKRFLVKVPGGQFLLRFAAKLKKEAKDFLVSSSLFEEFGLRYIGPIDGHDQTQLEHYLDFCKNLEEPVLLHVVTTKGKGYPIAIQEPDKFHGTSPFDIATGKSKQASTPIPNYQDVFGKALLSFAQRDKRIVGITAAMSSGTGLTDLASQLPEQFFDVGIAEEHAVLFAAGLATQGLRPVCAIYSTFLQRAVDPIIHDVCLQNLPVVFCLDRAGLSPNDGPTHHGLFDLAYLRSIPNALVLQPKDEDELVDMLWTSLQAKQPTFIRYPRGAGQGVSIKAHAKKLPLGHAECLKEGSDITLWALGPWVADALKLAKHLEAQEGLSVKVVNARWVKPLDRKLLAKCAATTEQIVVLEDHSVQGGLGSAVLEALNAMCVACSLELIAWPDQFITHGSSVSELRQKHDLSFEAVYEKVLHSYQECLKSCR